MKTNAIAIQVRYSKGRKRSCSASIAWVIDSHAIGKIPREVSRVKISIMTHETQVGVAISERICTTSLWRELDYSFRDETRYVFIFGRVVGKGV